LNSTTLDVGIPSISVTAPSLWDKAFDKLSEDDRAEIRSLDRLDCLERLLTETVKVERRCRKKQLKFQFGGKTFIVRDFAGKSIKWIS
jgi:hypothetical protein